MDLKKAVYNFLQGKASLTSLIGTRLYREVAPQKTVAANAAYIIYTTSDFAQDLHYRGAVGFAQRQFSFQIYAPNPETCDSIFQAMRNILHGRMGYAISDGVTNIDIQSSELLNCSDSYNSNSDGTELGLFEQDMTFLFRYQDVAPTSA